MIKPNHTHEWENIETVVIIRKRGVKTGEDTLKQRKCSCGKIETYDLQREKLA